MLRAADSAGHKRHRWRGKVVLRSWKCVHCDGVSNVSRTTYRRFVQDLKLLFPCTIVFSSFSLLISGANYMTRLALTLGKIEENSLASGTVVIEQLNIKPLGTFRSENENENEYDYEFLTRGVWYREMA